jgi:hypothetical protein
MRRREWDLVILIAAMIMLGTTVLVLNHAF